jgi:hypothetical protein
MAMMNSPAFARCFKPNSASAEILNEPLLQESG